MKSLYTGLQWLPAAPEDFGKRIKAAGTSQLPLGRELRALANYALDLDQSIRLAKALQKARAAGDPLEGLTAFRLAILSNSTVDFIAPALVAAATRHGFALEVIQPSYDQVAQEAFTPDSQVNASKPDAVLLALDYRAVPLKPAFGDAEAAAQNVQGVLAYLKSLQSAIKTNSGATCIFQTFAPPAETIFGNLDRALPGSIKNQLNSINAQLSEHCLESGDVLLDVDSLAQTVGIADWHDVRMWNMAKFAFSPDVISLYADHVARLIAALRGKSRRCLVLDLDNTVWGGIIGDDGLEGIRIAQGDSIGEAHLAVQKLALDLRARGIVLAVCSKNEDEIARTPFQQHPEMLLKLDHIAVFHANWNDKATNIKAIAEELSLGIDAMVFLDDNPVERGLVRQLLPSVAVPELPEDAALYARTLTAAGYFEAVTFAAEDLKRAGYYQDNARRVQLQKQVEGVDAYLASLDMTITFQPFDAPGRARIAQLINKSNQFNLTTHRYTETDVQAFEQDPSCFTLQVRLTDTFGDNGMISVILCKAVNENTWDIDTWLMSCRVLGRKVEHMVLGEILEHARKAGITRITGTFIPTDRNKLVVEHYSKLGFTKVAQDESGKTDWELDVATAHPETAPMQVVSRGFAALEESTMA